MFGFIKEIYREYGGDDAPRLAAALAYYTLFSLAPLLIIAIAIAGYVFGREAAQGLIVEELQGTIGTRAALLVQQLLLSASRPSSSVPATIIGFLLSLYGASHVFNHLNISLNRIWRIRQAGSGIVFWIKTKLIFILMVFSSGVFLLISLLAGAVLEWAGGYFDTILPGLFQTANFFLSFLFTTLLFAFIFKFIPDALIRFEPLLLGSLFTSIFFNLGKSVLGLYLGRSVYRSTYGAASSLIVLLIWIYFSAQILFLGAEFTKVYARRRKKPLLPSQSAARV
ncbi:MAG: YihY/virulence factor BrkB family protein [Fibrobacter sp.]|nr:YihY/virulence factor BrkB family protein [Fibrobacter sp.]